MFINYVIILKTHCQYSKLGEVYSERSANFEQFRSVPLARVNLVPLTIVSFRHFVTLEPVSRQLLSSFHQLPQYFHGTTLLNDSNKNVNVHAMITL